MKFVRLVLLCALQIWLSPVWATEANLRFSWWGFTERHELTQKAIRLFEERNLGIRIRAESGAFMGYRDRLRVQLSEGNEADIIQIDWSWLSEFTPDGNGFLDLYPYRNQLKLDEFGFESYKSGLVFGKLNALPMAFTARVYLWQKNTFDQANLPLPKTWDDLLAAGKIFKEKLGNDYYPLDGDPYDAILISHTYIHQKTGKPYIYSNQRKIALNRSEMLDWLHFYKTLQDQHVVVPLAKRLALGGMQRPTEQHADWANGKWAGLYTWNSTLRARAITAAPSAHFELGNFLSMPGAKNSGMQGRPAMMLAISKHCKNPAAAVKFVNFLLTDPDAQDILGMSRGFPLTRVGMDNITRHKLALPYEIKSVEQIKATRINNTSPLFEASSIMKLLLDTFEAYGLGKISDTAAADQLLIEGDRLIHEQLH